MTLHGSSHSKHLLQLSTTLSQKMKIQLANGKEPKMLKTCLAHRMEDLMKPEKVFQSIPILFQDKFRLKVSLLSLNSNMLLRMSTRKILKLKTKLQFQRKDLLEAPQKPQKKLKEKQQSHLKEIVGILIILVRKL